jgi:cell division septation protein DedD
MRRQQLFLALVLAAVLGLAACNREQSDWEKARAENNSDAYESFVKKYPNGAFTVQAQARLKEQYEERDWQKARDVDTSEAYQAFLKQYPEGKWSQEARIRVENFALAQATPGGPAPVEETPPVSGAPAPQGAAKPPSSTPPSSTPPSSTPRSATPPTSTPPVATAPVATPRTQATKPVAEKTAGERVPGGTVVQLGAFKSGKAAAEHRWTQLETKYPQLLQGLDPIVHSAKISHGTIYRLQVAGLAPVAAHRLCKKLAAHAEACLIVPNVHRK